MLVIKTKLNGRNGAMDRFTRIIRKRINRKDIASCILILMSNVIINCAEKASEPAPGIRSSSTQQASQPDESSGETDTGGVSKAKNKANINTSAKSDPNDSNPDQTKPKASFDLCTDGLKASTGLTDFSSQVKVLCDQKQLVFLQNPDNMYIGADNKLTELSKNKGDLETSFVIASSGLYDSDASDYWDMTRLQFLKPAIFKQNYLVDPNASMTEVSPAVDGSSFRYANNSGEGGIIDYRAKTVFMTLSKNNVWVAATMKIGSTIETMDSLRSLLIVVRSAKNPGKTELYSLSDQVYKHPSGQGDSYYSRAMNSLKNEQKNGFTNAKTSSNAKALLGQ